MRQQFLRCALEPRIGTMLAHDFGHGTNAGGCHERGSISQLERRNWQAPRSLTTQTPIWTRRNHAAHSVATPLWNKFNLALHRFAGKFANSATGIFHFAVHPNKPLLRGPENNRRFTAPIMWITVCEHEVVHQMSTLGDVLKNGFIGFPNRDAAQPLRHSVVIGSVVAHRAIGLKTFLAASAPIFLAVARRSVHKTSSIFKSDMRRGNYFSHTITERMRVLQTHKFVARGLAKSLNLLCANRFGNFFNHIAGDNAFTAINANQRIVVRAANGDGQIRGQRPRSRSPNHEAWS